MAENSEGFLYPTVNQDKCIDCNLCKKVCPLSNKICDDSMPEKAYAVRTLDENMLSNVASGGFFSILAKYLIEQGGLVWGAAFDDDFKVKHICIHEISDIYRLSSSKYVQSDLGNAFEEIKQQLSHNPEQMICFSGTPCQVSALKIFLKKDYINLLTVDMVCHGVPSPLLWDEYLRYMSKQFHSKIKTVNFRKKTYGYRSGSLELSFENGKKYFGTRRNDLMVKSFFSEISSRNSCYSCKFKTAKHSSDFTMFDCWHFHELTREKDDDKGYTNVFVQSKRGLEVFNKLHNMIRFYEIDAEEAISLDGKMVRNSTIPHKDRDTFYIKLITTSLENAVKEYIPISLFDSNIVKFRFILYKLGLLKISRNLLHLFDKK